LIKLYTEPGCQNCKVIKDILDDKGVEFTALNLNTCQDEDSIIRKAQEAGQYSLPIIIRNNTIVNSWRDLIE